jgi:polar amino acid transport system substrate-binding protein
VIVIRLRRSCDRLPSWVRVYAVVNLNFGMRVIPTMGLSGKVEPLLSRSAFDADFYVCFSKASVSPTLVDAFSRALKQFKQTEAYKVIYRKYFP